MKTLFTTFFACSISICNAQVNATIHLDSLMGSVDPLYYGINIWDGTNPTVLNDLDYQTNIDSLHLPIVRYHAYETVVEGNPKCWIDFANQKWQTQNIENSLMALEGKVGGRIMAIFNFPKWICPDTNNIKYIDTSKATLFADWCAALVDTVNNNLGLYCKYWEPFNELEQEYAGRIDELIYIYNKVAIEMKLKDASIKIGAPSLTQPYWSPAEQVDFYMGTANNLDFVSYHNYCLGSTSTSNQEIYDYAKGVGSYGIDAIYGNMVTAGIANKPLFLGETNLSYAFDLDPENKMASNVGAVGDAIILQNGIKNTHLTSVQLFNDRDGKYGKLSASNEKRPAYFNLQLMNQYMNQQWCKSFTNQDSVIQTLVCKIPNYTTVMLINTSYSDKNCSFTFTGWPSNMQDSATVFIVKNELNSYNKQWNNNNDTLLLPSESVTFLLFKDRQITELNEIDKLEDALVVSPNPSNGLFNLKINKASLKNITILNSEGVQITKSIQIFDSSVELNLRAEPAGIYFIKVTTDKNQKTYKIIKQ